MTAIPILLPVLLLAAAATAVIVGHWSGSAARVIAVSSTSLVAVLAAVGLVRAVQDGPLRHEVGGWPPPIGIEYVLDPLSGFVALVIGVIGVLVLVYPPQAGFDSRTEARVPLYPVVLLLLAGLLGVVMTGDLFNLFVFLEIYAIATYSLVSLGGPRAVFASFRYLIFGTIGSGFYLLGVGFLYFLTGSLNMADVATRLVDVGVTETTIAALALIVGGLAIKMALFPFHVWLPEAHSYAPPAVAAILAAVQVKVAAYALVRILYGVFGPGFVSVELPVSDLLVWFGAAGVIYGSMLAISQVDFKRMLAYSTVAQLGYIGIGIGLATPLALVGGLLHVLNHAVMKSCLFLVAGGVYEQTGIRQVARFAGLYRRMPVTAIALTVAALSMVGIPPTAGFFSKWYLVLGALEEGAVVVAVVVVASSLLTLWYFLRVTETVFSSSEHLDPALAAAREPRASVLGPVVFLAVAVIAIGLTNTVVVNQVLEPVSVDLLNRR